MPDSRPSNLTMNLRLQPPATAFWFANGAVDGASVVGGELGFQWKELWMGEAGASFLIWPDYRKSSRNEAHVRMGIAPIAADGRVKGAGWVLQAQFLGGIQYLKRYLDCEELGCDEATTGLSVRLGLEASRWSKTGRGAFTTRLSVGTMAPLYQTVTGDKTSFDRPLDWAMDVALDIGIAFR